MSEQTLFDSHHNLFETICSIEQLNIAFKAVKKNKGAPGIDGVTLEMFESNLQKELAQLSKELEKWVYKPKSVRAVEIPKSDGKSFRTLGIPTVRDRVVQAAIKAVLEPILDPKFSQSSYGFRPGRSQKQALEAAQLIVQSGKEFVVDIDLSKFFDRIGHDRLIYRLGTFISDKRVLRLVGIILRSGMMKDGLVTASKEGSVQGSPLSPLLSNVVLDELDKELERRGLSFCRWADDANIFVASKKAADRVMNTVSKFIENRLKLVVNREKSKVAESKFVKFLGMTIILGALAISKFSMAQAMEKVKELTPRGTSLSIEKSTEQINLWYVGWASYFSMTQYPSQLQKIESHVRRRLRARLVYQQKRPRILFNKLIKRGVSRRVASKTAFSNKGIWAKSHTAGVERAYPNEWFIKQLGLQTASSKALPHWFPVRTWIKLT